MPTIAEIRQQQSQPAQQRQPRVKTTIGALRRQQQPDTTPDVPGFGLSLGRISLASFLDNVLGAPEAIINTLRAETRGPSVGEAPAQLPPEMAGRAPIQQDPQTQERVDLPVPSSGDVLGAAQMAGEGVAALTTGDFGQFTPFPQAVAQQQQQQARIREERPGAALAGDVLGDVATLLTGRAPFARGRGMTQFSARQGGAVPFPLRAAPKGKQGNIGRIKAAADEIFTSDTMKTILNRAGRSAETGLEGAALGILNEGDPIELGAYAAGGQIGGSLALPMITTKGGLIGLAGAAAATGALLQFGKSAVPGGKDFILESLESGFDKVTAGIVIGSLSGMAGAGRLTRPEAIAKNLPEITDSMTAALRGSGLSVLQEFLGSDPNAQRDMEAVVSKLADNPEFFSPKERRELEPALTKSDVSFKKRLERLKKDKKFREKLAKIGG